MQHAGHTALLAACPIKQNSCDLDAQHQLATLKSIQPQKELHFKEEQQQQQQQQQQQHACQCTVCGDKALGYNFDAITCESCKAFFRRNALKTKIQKCNFESSCLVSVITRKFCPACRLAKCFKIERALGDTINGVDQNDSDRILTAAKEGGAAPETPFVITLSFVRRFVKFVKILPEFELIGKQDAGRLI
uniref:Nuclear receptor domain-containing protein n=1 Tax=Macrostomum lignano TaxID=282301 RepID=A0A1I8JHB2_9PLAT